MESCNAIVAIETSPAADAFWASVAEKAGFGGGPREILQAVYDAGANPGAARIFAAVAPLVAALGVK